MEILLIIPKYNFDTNPDYSYNFPLGLAYILSTIKKSGFSIDCLNMNHLSGKIEQILTSKLNQKKYDVICAGGNALLYSQFKTIINLIRVNSSNSTIILGGPIITSDPEFMFSSLKPDVAVIGEGEKTIIELLKTLEKKLNLEKIKGIIFYNKEKIVKTPEREPIKDIEKIPYPDFEGIGFSNQLNHMHCNDNWNFQAFDYPRTYPLLGSRGCPFNCSFCWHDMRYRARSIKDIIKEIEWAIEKYKINNVMIYDDCFSANKDRLFEFCKEIKRISKKLNCEIKWHCQLIVNSVDKEMLQIMKESGCEMISYGFESFSPIVLKSMRKPITPEKIDSTFKATLNAKIGIQGNFIFGDIAETKETAKETLDYWKKNAKAQISLGFVEPYPGSDIYKYCIEKGIIKDKLDFIQNKMGSDARINMTKEMSDEELQELNLALLTLFSKYAKFVKPKKMKKTQKNIYSFKVKCPYCNTETLYKNCYVKNPFSYGFHLICRDCHMRFVLVSEFQKLAYKFYPSTRKLRDKYIQIKKQFKKRII
jgi:radical SAM superfamily enzyme YgiQ (UPF0313 family)